MNTGAHVRNLRLRLVRSDGDERLIERSSLRLLDTIDSVLNLSKIESGSVEPDLKTVDVADELLGTIEIFRLQAAKKRIDLHADVSDDSIEAVMDPSYRHCISDNLIGNAVKFTPEGGTVHVRLNHTDDTVMLEVSDTGIGSTRIFWRICSRRLRGAPMEAASKALGSDSPLRSV